MPRNRQAFTVGFGRENLDPGYVDKWFGLRGGVDSQNGTSAARLAGGYRTNNESHYNPFPEGAKQGELFNWEPPRIKGLYRGDNSPEIDLGTTLGMAVAESRKRYGVNPIPDHALTADSARVSDKLLGGKHDVNYRPNDLPEDLREYGNNTTQWVDDMANNTGYRPAGNETTMLPPSAIEEGSKTIRDAVRNLRKNKQEIRIDSFKQESPQGPAFKQDSLPGFEKA